MRLLRAPQVAHAYLKQRAHWSPAQSPSCGPYDAPTSGRGGGGGGGGGGSKVVGPPCIYFTSASFCWVRGRVGFRVAAVIFERCRQHS